MAFYEPEHRLVVLLFNDIWALFPSHEFKIELVYFGGILIEYPPFIPTWSLSKSLSCLDKLGLDLNQSCLVENDH